MVDFPENEVQLFRDYNSAGLIADSGARIRQELAKAANPNVFKELGSGIVRRVTSARQDLRAFLTLLLDGPAATAVQVVDGVALLAPDNHGVGVYERIAQREFGLALQQLASVTGTVPAPLDRASVDLALQRDSIKFFFEVQQGGELVGKIGHLPGYAGPDLTSRQRRRLVEYSHLFVEGVERWFWLDGLRAECHMGLADLGNVVSALELYNGILA